MNPINKLQVDKIPLDTLRDKPAVQKVYEAPKVALSENIQAFDKKPRVFTQNPYDYNSVSLHKSQSTPTAEAMITDPTYNLAAKALGVDTVHDWNRYYDKVEKIVTWAREKTGYNDSEKLASWIYSQLKNAPSMGEKRIDDLYIYSRLKTEKKAKPVVKTVVKKVYVKQKMTQDEMINNLIQGL